MMFGVYSNVCSHIVNTCIAFQTFSYVLYFILNVNVLISVEININLFAIEQY